MSAGAIDFAVHSRFRNGLPPNPGGEKLFPAFTWNVLTNNFRAEDILITKLRERIPDLERFLKQLSPRSVHLQIMLGRDSRQPGCRATLTLRLPRNILRSEESADDPLKAFQAGLKSLRSQLESQKDDLRAERLPKAARLRNRQHDVRFADQPEAGAIGPQNYEDVVRDFFEQNYNRLLYDIRRHLKQAENTADLPVAAVDPSDIVDEVACQAEAKPNERPPTVTWLVWVFHLMHQEIRRQLDFYRQKRNGEIRTEKPARVPELSPKKLQPLEHIVQKKLDPQVIRVDDVVPGSGRMSEMSSWRRRNGSNGCCPNYRTGPGSSARSLNSIS